MAVEFISFTYLNLSIYAYVGVVSSKEDGGKTAFYYQLCPVLKVQSPWRFVGERLQRQKGEESLIYRKLKLHLIS